MSSSMASISPRTFSDSNLHIFASSKPRFPFPLLKPSSPSLTLLSHSHSRFSGSSLCRCQNNNDNDSSSLDRRWESAINGVFKNVMKMFDDYLNAGRNQNKELIEDSMSLDVVDREKEVDDWDWDRWRKHFTDVDDQERLVSILQSQLSRAISGEDYEDAARLKVAIAAAATNDTVGRVMSYLDRAIEEERYTDAAFVRDNAGAGLVGWWAGVSEDRNDPYGRIIHIDAEHGRYIARSYSFRQLSSSTVGAPLFEVFLTKNKKGEYKQQAVYLKHEGVDRDFTFASLEPLDQSNTLKPVDPTDGQDFLLTTSDDDREDDENMDDDSDITDESGFQNILSDMIPGVKVKVLKVTTPEKVDRDLLSKVVEQIMEEEDEEETDDELDNFILEKDGAKGDNDEDKIINQIEKDGKNGISDGDDESQIAIKVVVGEFREKSSNGNKSQKDTVRVPARIEKKGRLSFSFFVEGDEKKLKVSGKNLQPTLNKKPKRRAHRSVDHVMFDLAKFMGKGKIPKKVLKDVGELINITIRQSRYRQPLSGSTTFNRIEISSSPDPLNGLYIGAHGLYTSEVIHLRRKFGQWQDDGAKKGPQNLEFYEYVEAVKLTGDPYVPAGEVAFRAKVGKRYQLPHKGIIPEEFGVIARYRGQGRLAEPGFRNPRWVDGELVILDGKYIKGGPVVGFVYWDPEYQFLVFFNQLRLKH